MKYFTVWILCHIGEIFIVFVLFSYFIIHYYYYYYVLPV